jgi:hypothetical protein
MSASSRVQGELELHPDLQATEDEALDLGIFANAREEAEAVDGIAAEVRGRQPRPEPQHAH